MIPICLILFILFIAVITFAIKRADSAQAKVTEEFWEKERKANSTLRGDTTDLCYITIPEKFFPLNNDKINDLRDKTLVNLTGMTNTDLKLKYGILNFKKLSEYDDNFTKFVSMLPDYYNRLKEAGYESLGNELLELAVEHRLAELIEKAKQLNSLSRDGIVSMLESLQADVASAGN